MARFFAPAALVLAALGITAPAIAQPAPAPKLRVVECGAESCLRITGHRDDSAAPVPTGPSLHDDPFQGQSWSGLLAPSSSGRRVL